MNAAAGKHDQEAALRAAASRWAVRMSSPDASAAERAACAQWRNADPRHDALYRSMAVDWKDMETLRGYVDRQALMGAPTLQERMVAAFHAAFTPRPMRWAMAAVAVVVGAGLSMNTLLAPPSFETAVGEIRDIALADGSTVTLGADSRIETDFSAGERRIVLGRGEAFFNVAKDAARPFIVVAGDTRARAVGTQFDVHRGQQETRVAVLEGLVEVITAHGPKTETAAAPVQPSLVHPGQELVAPLPQSAKPVRVAAVNDVSPWRKGRLEYDNVSLREVIADANRYRENEIVLASADLAELHVTTSFPAEHVEKMIDSLGLALPLTVERKANGTVILKRKTEAANAP